jgi:hypothetical protein
LYCVDDAGYSEVGDHQPEWRFLVFYSPVLRSNGS